MYETLQAIVGVRSPHTITKRADSLFSFLRWFTRHVPNEPLSFDEQVIWRFFKHLRELNSAPIKISPCMSAFRFARYVLGVKSFKNAVSSRRLSGLAEITLAGKRPLKQAKVLTVVQVLKLRTMLSSPEIFMMDKVLIGYTLFALYAPCRHSDLLHVQKLSFDCNESKGLTECWTCRRKTGRSAQLKTRLLPIVAPARGVDGKVWAAQVQSIFQLN